jgi:ribonuclease P protein component
VVIFQSAMLKKITRNTLPKSARLSSKKTIDILFNEGITIKSYPFIVKYHLLEKQDERSSQVLFSVSKRNFKRAVERNKIKRQMREAFRHHKASLMALPKKYAIAYIYTARKILPFKEIESKLKASVLRLEEELT